jgi:cyanophycinase
MMGGGTDLDEAFRWLCDARRRRRLSHPARTRRRRLQPLCARVVQDQLRLDPDYSRPRHPRQDPHLAEIIRHAEAVFIAGGDQALYVRYWQGTPVQDAINANSVSAGKPIGGTSAGLAILGQFSYGALNDPDDSELHSKDASAEPISQSSDDRERLPQDSTTPPARLPTATSPRRDRMGRTLVFPRPHHARMAFVGPSPGGCDR